MLQRPEDGEKRIDLDNDGSLERETLAIRNVCVRNGILLRNAINMSREMTYVKDAGQVSD